MSPAAPPDLDALVDDRPHDGVFRVRGAVFADPALFELEMRHVFGRSWVFLALEAQLPAPRDFVTAWIGRTPVLVQRDDDGHVAALLNVCPHKGALLVAGERGCSKVHVCPYHGWAFDSAGRNVHIKDEASGHYGAGFREESHDLLRLPRVARCGGLVFGSLAADGPTLDEWLGDAREFIELAMQQGRDGLEVVPGRVAYTYQGNWKLQMDNGLDGYHLTSTHAAFMDVQQRRREGEGFAAARQYDWRRRQSQRSGIFTFANGHAVTWMDQAEPQKRPIFPVIDEIRERVGTLRADWMLKGRSLTIFPNVQIADQTSLNLRTFRPIAPDLTEMRMYCLAPRGEAPDRRAWRLRQFEDFFAASGLATPDDTTVYEAVQRGCSAAPMHWLQGYQRGLASLGAGADDAARELGVAPLSSQHGDFDCAFETGLHAHYRQWKQMLAAGLAREAAP